MTLCGVELVAGRSSTSQTSIRATWEVEIQTPPRSRFRITGLYSGERLLMLPLEEYYSSDALLQRLSSMKSEGWRMQLPSRLLLKASDASLVGTPAMSYEAGDTGYGL